MTLRRPKGQYDKDCTVYILEENTQVFLTTKLSRKNENYEQKKA